MNETEIGEFLKPSFAFTGSVDGAPFACTSGRSQRTIIQTFPLLRANSPPQHFPKNGLTSPASLHYTVTSRWTRTLPVGAACSSLLAPLYTDVVPPPFGTMLVPLGRRKIPPALPSPHFINDRALLCPRPHLDPHPPRLARKVEALPKAKIRHTFRFSP